MHHITNLIGIHEHHLSALQYLWFPNDLTVEAPEMMEGRLGPAVIGDLYMKYDAIGDVPQHLRAGAFSSCHPDDERCVVPVIREPHPQNPYRFAYFSLPIDVSSKVEILTS